MQFSGTELPSCCYCFNLSSQSSFVTVPHISVCICTFRRAEMLRRLLQEVARQDTGGRFTYSVVVADNDAQESARQTVLECSAATGSAILYTLEPRRNIALARNAALAKASGDYVAFIDDDEFPSPAWLRLLLETSESHQADGVLGPVEPHFDPDPPAWVRRAGFYQRPRHQTGFTLAWPECRTGNVLLRRALVVDVPEPFRAEFGSGGEDQDFFRRAIQRGCRFVWCDEAVVAEEVPPGRWKLAFLMKRAFLRGKNSRRHRTDMGLRVAKSAIALPIYIAALPLLAILGIHLFFRYLIKACDHAGLLLAVLGVNPVKGREM